jgi:NADP-dependent alcohol dehydrogenase
MEQYLYPHEGYLQDRIAEEFFEPWLFKSGRKLKIMPWHLTLCGVVLALNGLIQKGVPSDWAI